MNRHLLASWVIGVALVGAAGCKPAAVPEEFPQAAADGWLAAFNSGDAEGLALMYSQQSEVLPPDEPIVSGAARIEQFWRDYSPGQVRLEISDVEVSKLGDYWYREGNYTALVQDEGMPRIGKFIELWVKEGSAWLLYRHMWSPNSPPPAEMPATAPAG
jgi:ketosteroid isomerase-like protein